MTLPDTMRAGVTMGHGGLDRLVLHEDWPRPDPGRGEVLIAVGACGLNNTGVNTRSGWYSRTATEATTGGVFATGSDDDPTWSGAPIRFPRIKGADICGRIVALGAGVDAGRIGVRVITETWLCDPADPLDKKKSAYLGSERDGGLAESATVPAQNAIAGPMVKLDLRPLCLRDLTVTGSTVIEPEGMPNLVRHIEAGEVRPILAAAYRLEGLRAAQAAFIEKRHTGDTVVIP